MTASSPTSVSPTTHTVTRRRLAARVGVQAFWSLLALQALLIALAALWLYNGHPDAAPAPVVTTSELTIVHEAIESRLQGRAPDPIIAIGSQAGARESNLRGFQMEDTIYYYYIDRHDASNYDPLSRGAVSPASVEVLLRDESEPYPLVIYRIYDE